MKILYIQHASEFGGSVVSLKNQLLELKKSYKNIKITILLVKYNENIMNYYESFGFETVYFEKIHTFEHTTAKYYNLYNPFDLLLFIIQAIYMPISIYRSIKSIIKVNPDIVHLNSSVLIPSAIAVKLLNKKLVWHIRENPYFGFLKIRYYIFSNIINLLSDYIIFICNSDRVVWRGGNKSIIIYNFVDLDVFNPHNKIQKKSSDKILLFLGGVNKIKGFIVLLKSIVILKNKYNINNIRILCPGLLYKTPTTYTYRILSYLSSCFGVYPNSKKIEKYIKDNELENILMRREFTIEVESLFKISDIVIFPSLVPHFARPIIEGSSMGLPSIGSNLPGVNELIIDNITGLLFEPMNEMDLAIKINTLLNNERLFSNMKVSTRILAEKRYDVSLNVKEIYLIYESLINRYIN